jgi:hypothetical protein
MSITLVGSIAFDAVKTPAGERERMLGGAAHSAAETPRNRRKYRQSETRPLILRRA